MNKLLQSYCLDVEYPAVSGAEHLQMLRTRDKLEALILQLSNEEQHCLRAADRRLVEQTAAFYAELARFVDMAEHRRAYQILPSQWWWYLYHLELSEWHNYSHAGWPGDWKSRLKGLWPGVPLRGR